MVTSSCLNDDTSQPYMFTSHKHYTQWNIEYYIIYPSFPQKKSPVENGNVHLSCLARCPLYPLLVAVLKLFTLSLTMSDWSKRKEPEFPELRLTGHHVHSATSLYISICIYIYTYLFPIMPKYVSRFAQLWYFSPHVKFASRTTWIAQTWDSNLDFLSKIEFIEGISSWGG